MKRNVKKRNDKYFHKGFALFWCKCLLCEQEVKFERIYFHIDAHGSSTHYCKECYKTYISKEDK